MLHFKLVRFGILADEFQRHCKEGVATPNDPKLSDRVGRKQAWNAL
jgi:hypothetical protein